MNLFVVSATSSSVMLLSAGNAKSLCAKGVIDSGNHKRTTPAHSVETIVPSVQPTELQETCLLLLNSNVLFTFMAALRFILTIRFRLIKQAVPSFTSIVKIAHSKDVSKTSRTTTALNT